MSFGKSSSLQESIRLALSRESVDEARAVLRVVSRVALTAVPLARYHDKSPYELARGVPWLIHWLLVDAASDDAVWSVYFDGGDRRWVGLRGREHYFSERPLILNPRGRVDSLIAIVADDGRPLDFVALGEEQPQRRIGDARRGAFG